MSTNKKHLTIDTGVSPEESKEAMLYRPQLLKYKYKTCIEKPVLTDTYDPDTMNSLKSLMKTTSINLSHQRNNNLTILRMQRNRKFLPRKVRIYYLNGLNMTKMC